MFSSSGRRRALASLFLILILVVIPFIMIYYTSTGFQGARYQQWLKRNERASQPNPSGQPTDQFIVSRDKKLEINKICIEFKGVREHKFILNLYLLDFDRQQPFPMEVSKKEARESITFGGNQFVILSGNDRLIKVKLIDSYQTP